MAQTPKDIGGTLRHVIQAALAVGSLWAAWNIWHAIQRGYDMGPLLGSLDRAFGYHDTLLPMARLVWPLVVFAWAVVAMVFGLLWTATGWIESLVSSVPGYLLFFAVFGWVSWHQATSIDHLRAEVGRLRDEVGELRGVIR